jgi:hypothetical protein
MRVLTMVGVRATKEAVGNGVCEGGRRSSPISGVKVYVDERRVKVEVGKGVAVSAGLRWHQLCQPKRTGEHKRSKDGKQIVLLGRLASILHGKQAELLGLPVVEGTLN